MHRLDFGLARCLDDILGYDPEGFIELQNRVKEIFPDIKTIRLIPEPTYCAPTDDPMPIPTLNRSDGKGIYFEFVTGQQASALQMSDGVRLVRVSLTVLYLPQPR